LGILYEDAERYDEASNCFTMVENIHCTLPRAQIYNRDAEASMVMYYDEEKEKKEDKQAQILRIPVTDFELSVRSRNCLCKMNLQTLGDLISKTEAELLAFKNFGETSLQEIKGILASKGLRLGMITPDTEEIPSFIEPVSLDSKEDSILSKPLDELDLSVRSRNCLTLLQIKTLGQLAEITEQQLVSCKNFGQTSLNEIRKKLSDYGLSLKV
ncbi:MAG: DNA-directed RNA polymerase subunit alpha C-terminal domain-containing protein, partial [Planctomycetota bacterium]